jgi:hypothetical protein
VLQTAPSGVIVGESPDIKVFSRRDAHVSLKRCYDDDADAINLPTRH